MASLSATVAAISTRVMIAAVILLFLLVVFIFFLYLLAKHYMGSSFSSRASLYIFSPPNQPPISPPGLDPELLKILPVSVSKSGDSLECSVCLSEISEGEELRLLPKCGHRFHVHCIDMWFQSHTTCPLCRAPITGEVEPDGVPLESAHVTRNAVDDQEGSPSLVIEIPREEIMEMEEMKSPRSGRLKSLRRLLSRGKMVVGSPSSSWSPRGGDAEEGAGVTTPAGKS